MKTNLAPERKEIRDAQESKWYGGSKGYCCSWPYQIKRFLSSKLSEQIQTEVKNKCDEWIMKLESIKPSKRIGAYCHWCKELDPQRCGVDSHEENAIQTKVLGHKVYVKILDTYCKKNGQSGIKPMEKPVLEISRYVNSPHDGDWHHIGEQLNFEIRWSEEKQLYYVNEYRRAENKPIEEITSKYWGRTNKRKEFMNEVKKLEDNLIESGVTILRLIESHKYKHGLENMFIECEGPDIV